ncbi:pimeloyl-ACP methyl ester carboxylesterase [Pararhizobium capsulatum DSM 1112]|uniref:Pimeloyl-ACP methyl ester carboxylesterase n=1 Tax=Pararhizobium capsulatum DSM 1112 TaxID=1121113 RepID=A0ABU0BLX2_9HYPH|nr:alpha/beta hydrolase [Pararhizobium capsulatum]MDQ0319246.1 pimeloyl-ACP methyl ester carboxylesterase [Pararhizobium capsulatum DSM 1112]
MLREPPTLWLSKDAGMKTVLIHGMVMSPSFWSCFAPTIVREGRAAAYPLPGHSPWSLEGRTAPLRTSDIVDAYARAIERDFDGEPVTLIGHSTGGFVSLLLARHRPDLVSNLILMGAFACGRFEGQERIAAKILRLPLLGRVLFARLFTRWISTRESFRWGSLECVFDPALSWETEETLAAMEQVRTGLLSSHPDEIAAFVSWMSSTSVLSEVQDIDVPVLNIIGAHDRIVPPAHQLHLSGGLRRVQTVILGKVGHLPMAEAREKVDRLIANFMLFGPLTSRTVLRGNLTPAPSSVSLPYPPNDLGNKTAPTAFS